MDILFIPLEFSTWNNARRWSYLANLALEEGFAANDVRVTTVPAIREFSSNDRGSWLKHIRKFIGGKRFDQAWIVIPHARYEDNFLDWFRNIAPVRVGIVSEHLAIMDEEWHRNFVMSKDRQIKTEKGLAAVTHALLPDEIEVQLANQAGISAFWMLNSVPERFILGETDIDTAQPALFYGALYGDRKNWFEHPALKGLLNSATSTDEDETDYPWFLEHIISVNSSCLSAGMSINGSLLENFLADLRKTRQRLFRIWLENLKNGSAVINLPQPVTSYSSRVYEGMAAGRPVITPLIANRPLTQKLFEDGREILLYDRNNPESLADAIKKLKADPAYVRRIVRASQAKLRSFHTAEARVRQILDWIETGGLPEFSRSVSEDIHKTDKEAVTLHRRKTVQEKTVDALSHLISGKRTLKLHLGCGEQHFPGYVNIDYPQDHHTVQKNKADVFADITKLSFPDNSVDEIRLHHVFEHFDRAITLGLITRWHSWLKTGGILHIETPDLTGCARHFLTDSDYQEKQALVRHLFGSHEACWAYHLDGWHDERYVHVLTKMGFDVTCRHFEWQTKPRLANIDIIATKKKDLKREDLLDSAREILKDYMVANVPGEMAMHAIWHENVKQFVLGHNEFEVPSVFSPGHCCAVIFSKDRAMQLDFTLRTLMTHCRDIQKAKISVLYKATDEKNGKHYAGLGSEYPDVEFRKEGGFKSDLLQIIDNHKFVMFVVDDCIFCADFFLEDAIGGLQRNPDAIGVSLRLGMNTRYCYMLDRSQPLPAFSRLPDGLLDFDWTQSSYDFGYPLELSSSLYRTAEISPFLKKLDFNNPNVLEAAMDTNKAVFSKKPKLLCYTRSVAFCNPMNKVQSVFTGNRSGSVAQYSGEYLADLYESGYRLDDEQFSLCFVPESCHQELNVTFVRVNNIRPRKYDMREDNIETSIIIVNWNETGCIRQCIDSIMKHTEGKFEIIVVNNNATNDSSEYLRSVNGLTLIENPENYGPAAARNQGIEVAKGDWLVFLDDDVIVSPGWLKKLLGTARNNPDVAMLGALSNTDPEIAQVAGEDLPTAENVDKTATSAFDKFGYGIDFRVKLSGFCMLINKKVIEKIGVFDESLGLVGFEDDDYSLRAFHAGFFPALAKGTYVYHAGGREHVEKRNYSELFRKSWEAFKKKWNLPESLDCFAPYHTIPLISRTFRKETDYTPARSEKTENTDDNFLVSIIILSYNGVEHIKACIESVKRNTPQNHEIIVVDNGKKDGSLEYLHSLPFVCLVENPENRGPAVARAQGMSLARGKYTAFIDDDTIVTKDWITKFIEITESHPDIGMLGAVSNYASGFQLVQNTSYSTIKELEDFAGRHYEANRGKLTLTPRLVSFCLFTTSAVSEKIGTFDSRFGLFGFEDDDYSLRAYIAGFKPSVAHEVFIHHTGGPQGRGNEEYNRRMHEAWRIYKDKWEIPQDIPYGSPFDIVSIMSQPFDPKRHFVAIPDIARVNPLLYRSGQLPRDDKSSLQPGRKRKVKTGSVSVVLVASGPADRTKQAIESVQSSLHVPCELTLITKEAASKFGKIKKSFPKDIHFTITNSKDDSFALQCNKALEKTSGEYILILSDDTVLSGKTMPDLVAYMQKNTDCGIAAPVTNNAIGIQKLSLTEGAPIDEIRKYALSFIRRNANRTLQPIELDHFCLLVRSKLIDTVGFFDTDINVPFFAVNDYLLRTIGEGYSADVLLDWFVYREHSGIVRRGLDPVFREKWDTINVKSDTGRRISLFFALHRAWSIYSSGNLNRAIDTLMDEIKSIPDDESVYYCLARILIEEKRYRDAIDALEQIPPDKLATPKTLEMLARCSHFLSLPDEAGGHAAKGIAISPDYPDLLDLQGILSLRDNKRAEAEDYFNRALALDENCADPYIRLGVLKWQDGDHEKGLELIEKGFIRSPETGDFSATYQSAITSLKEFERAEGVLREVMGLYPDNKNLRIFYIGILLEQKKARQAMAVIEDTVSLFGADDAMLDAALAVRRELGPITINKDGKDSATLSACIIAKNEETYIAKCLASLKPVADEIVVVDTGSTDRTRKIAEAFGAKVYDFPWTDDFSEARNVSLEHAQGDWILVHDADETLSPLDYDAFRELIRVKPAVAPFAYHITTRNYTMEPSINGWKPNDGSYDEEESGNGWFPSVKVRLFPNDERIRFANPVHELVEPSILAIGMKIKVCAVPVHHYGKLPSEKNAAKFEAYYNLGIKKLEDQGKTPTALQEAAIAAAEMKKYDEAIAYWQEYIKLDSNNVAPFFNLATLYIGLHQYEEALIAAARARELDPLSKEAALTYGAASLYTANPSQAVSALEDLLQRNPVYPPADLCLAAAYCMTGKEGQARELMDKLSKNKFKYFQTLYSLAQHLIDSGKTDFAMPLLKVMKTVKPSDGKVTELIDQCTAGLA